MTHLPVESMRARLLALATTIAASAWLAGCADTEPLAAPPKLNIAPDRVSVSGLSSGAYMAQQFHLAHSDRLVGAALLAGGPYGCAEGSLQTALDRCMAPAEGKGPDASALAATARERAAAGKLAPLEGLRGDRVFVFHGNLDATVGADVTEASAALYEALDAGVSIVRDMGRPIAHLMPLAGKGDDCAATASPFMARCEFDAAGAALKSLYAAEAAASTDAQGALMTIDATAGLDAVPGDEKAFLYVPKQCSDGAACGLHIAFHGCQQSASDLGDRFARDAGYNRWADAMDLVVLYPQTVSSMMPLNPKACWDWWGYTGADYDTRDGAQIEWVAAMANQLGARFD